MRSSHRLVSLALLVVGTLAGPVGPSGSAATAADDLDGRTTASTDVAGRGDDATGIARSHESEIGVITLHDADPRWLADIESGLRRFTEIGLAPVVTEVHVWDASRRERCGGHAGLFTPTSAGSRVDLCLDHHPTDLGTHLRHKLILHELAHAWIDVNTSAADRERFMALRGAEGWNDREIEHFARGTERAANAIAAMLHPDPSGMESNLCGYELLTGGTAVAGRPDPCSIDVGS